MVAFLLFTACLDPVQTDDSTGGTDDSGDTDNTVGGDGSIYDVRSGVIGDGDSVRVAGVLVSSPPTREDNESGKSDGFFIQEPDGGPNSGLYVWSPNGFGDELNVQPGDEVTISGQISEFFDWTELVVGDASSIEVTGSGTLPAPIDLGDGAGVDWNEYESVPVTLTNQDIVSVDSYNTGVLSAGINLDDGFVYNDYDCRGSYESVTGIVFYQYEAWSINNRNEGELVGYTAPAQIDTTIAEIRQGLVCGIVRLEEVVAISSSLGSADDETTVFVQDAGGGEYSGIVVFIPSTHLDIAPGDLVTVIGSVSDYFGLAEIYVPEGEGSYGVTSGGGTPVASVLTEIPADWEPYESTLVTLQNVTATSSTSDTDAYGAVSTDWGVQIDNIFYAHETNTGTVFSSVTGPLYYTSFDDIPVWSVEPRGADDLVE